MVRAVGIEPTLLAELDFKSSASTTPTTPARHAQPTYPRQTSAFTELGASTEKHLVTTT